MSCLKLLEVLAVHLCQCSFDKAIVALHALGDTKLRPMNCVQNISNWNLFLKTIGTRFFPAHAAQPKSLVQYSVIH